MPSRNQSVPVELLLEAARRRVTETSLRDAAAEIGMEHSGLNKLLGGTHPRPSTVRKLTVWYLKRAATGELEVVPEIAQAALAVLLQHLPHAARAEAQTRVVEVVREIGQERGVPAPGWLEERT